MAITVKTTFNDEARAALRDLALVAPVNIKKRKLGKVLFAVAVLLFALAAVMTFLNHRYVLALVCVVGAALCMWMTMPGAQRYQDALMSRAQQKQMPETFPKQAEYSFNEESVVISSSAGLGAYTWDSFLGWGTVKNFMYVKRADGPVLLIDTNTLTEEEVATLAALLTEHLAKEN